MSPTLLDAILEAQSLPREAQEGPKTSQNGPQNVKKTMLKNKAIPYSIFSWILLFFLMVFWMFFWSQKSLKWLKTVFAKTWKIVIFPRENWYFQGFEGLKLKWASYKK